MKLYWCIFWCSWSLFILSIEAQEVAKVLNLKRLDQCIEPLRGEEKMTPPFFLVPIQPESQDELDKIVRFDLDTGKTCFHGHFDRVKFSVLSINQGQAVNIDLNYIDEQSRPKPPSIINRTHLIRVENNLDQILITCSNQTDVNSLKIDEHLFYQERQPSNDSNYTSLNIFLVNETEAKIKLKCQSDEFRYTLKLVSDPKQGYNFAKSGNLILLRRLPEEIENEDEIMSSAPILEPILISTTTATEITRTITTLTKLSLNLKLLTIIAITLASLLVLLFYIVVLTMKRLVLNNQFYASSQQPKTDESDTIQTQSTTSNVFTLEPQIQSGTIGDLTHSNQYLSRLGIDMMGNLRSLMSHNPTTQNTLYVSDHSLRTITSVSATEKSSWNRLLNWTIDFNSMSDVFEDLVKFK